MKPRRVAERTKDMPCPTRSHADSACTTAITQDRLQAAFLKVREDVLREREAAGHWVGELATSALSTATAVSALALVQQHDPDAEPVEGLIADGIRYLATHQNDDGGWGDTDRSYSNIATTMLVRSAFFLSGAAAEHTDRLERAEKAIQRQGGLAGLRARFGKDRTFAVPILTNAALAGHVPWTEVPSLPFELACVPQRFYRFVRLPVVSYAIPALVAIGQARHFHAPSRFAPLRMLRRLATAPSLRVLLSMQPGSGGYLEATPLTSFVVMSLAAIGCARHPVVRQGVKFLADSVRPDGSWPIDTNLATWTTTLAINALAGAGEDVTRLACLPWLLECQHRQRHPFTGAAPGGWGWSDLSGAVPDADDTPGALLALAAWCDAPSATEPVRSQIREATDVGIRWLLDMQNRNGGWPTFCRGWGKLPFDRSGADLTAHSLRALRAWSLSSGDHRVARAITRGFRFLAGQQRSDGSWIPLWFGNQDHPGEENPVYGTARVLLAYRDAESLHDVAAERGAAWLLAAQNADGGWGGGPVAESGEGEVFSSVEETAVTVEALTGFARDTVVGAATNRGIAWLVAAVESDRYLQPAPIGFYFAKLWYYERLYPRIFTLAALGQALATLTLRQPGV